MNRSFYPFLRLSFSHPTSFYSFVVTCSKLAFHNFHKSLHATQSSVMFTQMCTRTPHGEAAGEGCGPLMLSCQTSSISPTLYLEQGSLPDRFFISTIPRPFEQSRGSLLVAIGAEIQCCVCFVVLSRLGRPR